MSAGSHVAYVDVYAYSSTPGNAEHGQRVIGWAESGGPQPSGTPTKLSSSVGRSTWCPEGFRN